MKGLNQSKKDVIFWSQQLYNKGFASTRSGNLSCAVDKELILITAHDSYLGYMQESDVVLVDRKGKVVGKGEPSYELRLHLGIHNLLKTQVVMHAHSIYTTAYFNYFKKLSHFSYESEMYLRYVPVVPQKGPNVTDVKPVIRALEDAKIVVLKNHGVVARGDDFKSTFCLIELLEDTARLNFAVAGKIKTKRQR
jgi:L-fuculose-phosphate aldolase